MSRVLYCPGQIQAERQTESRVLLAVYLPHQDQDNKKSKTRKPQEDDNDKAKAAVEITPKKTRRYTAPGAAVRQAALAALALTTSNTSQTTMDSGGRELSEAMSAGSGSANAGNVLGATGLAAPVATVAGVVVSRPGLQEGAASGLGFVSSFNILTPQLNPLSGTMGRCQDLINAGFFGGSESTCLLHFQPR